MILRKESITTATDGGDEPMEFVWLQIPQPDWVC